MDKLKPRLYLDKGTFRLLDILNLSNFAQICYSEATLLDLLNDKSSWRDQELSTLNNAKALYCHRDSNQVVLTQADAHELMESIDPIEVDFMASVYRFVNGGGTHTAFNVLQNQLSILYKSFDKTTDIDPGFSGLEESDQALEPLKNQTAEQWYRELQRATKSWNQSQGFTLRSIFDKYPDLKLSLNDYFPDSVPNPERIHCAAMLLGVLQMGSDKGIRSENDETSGKAARNGYVDCLHVMFGLHCDIFLTTDKPTLRRFQLLNGYWNLGRECALVYRPA